MEESGWCLNNMLSQHLPQGRKEKPQTNKHPPPPQQKKKLNNRKEGVGGD